MKNIFANFAQRTGVSSPLTPALSPWERENRIQSLGKSSGDICRERVQETGNRRLLSPLPEGEGQGEGKSGMNHSAWVSMNPAMNNRATP